MTIADRLTICNRWYDETPEDWRAHLLLWPLVIAGFINMQLSISSGFPFGILVLLVVLAFLAIRAPYVRGWIVPASDAAPEGAGHGARLVLGRFDGLYDLNTRYDDMPEMRRFLVLPTILIVVGAINMWLTIWRGWAFGGLFLLALLVLLAIRTPYIWGLLAPPPTRARGPVFASLAHDLNASFDGMPSERRFWGFALGLVVVVLVDLMLSHGTASGLIGLLVVEALILAALRGPYLGGSLTPPVRHDGAAAAPQLGHDNIAPLHLAPAPHVAALQPEPIVSEPHAINERINGEHIAEGPSPGMSAHATHEHDTHEHGAPHHEEPHADGASA